MRFCHVLHCDNSATVTATNEHWHSEVCSLTITTLLCTVFSCVGGGGGAGGGGGVGGGGGGC